MALRLWPSDVFVVVDFVQVHAIGVDAAVVASEVTLHAEVRMNGLASPEAVFERPGVKIKRPHLGNHHTNYR